MGNRLCGCFNTTEAELIDKIAEIRGQQCEALKTIATLNKDSTALDSADSEELPQESQHAIIQSAMEAAYREAGLEMVPVCWTKQCGDVREKISSVSDEDNSSWQTTEMSMKNTKTWSPKSSTALGFRIDIAEILNDLVIAQVRSCTLR